MHYVPLKKALTFGGACSPCNRSGLDAGVPVEKLQTNTLRIPAETGIPAWVTSPPNNSALPGLGFKIVSGSSLGFSSTARLPAQKPVPPLHPPSSSSTISNKETISARDRNKKQNVIQNSHSRFLTLRNLPPMSVESVPSKLDDLCVPQSTRHLDKC